MNQKLEEILQLALQTPEDVRDRTEDLNVGFDGVTRTWELIVKYHGDLSSLRAEGIQVVELMNEYAILTVPESLIERLADVIEIEYIEKPKRLFFSVNQGKAASCITGVQNLEC